MLENALHIMQRRDKRVHIFEFNMLDLYTGLAYVL